MPGEMNITLSGIAGDFCSPRCQGITVPSCIKDYEPGLNKKTEASCIIQENGVPTYCALICQKGTAIACGYPATCMSIPGWGNLGVCTYPSSDEVKATFNYTMSPPYIT